MDIINNIFSKKIGLIIVLAVLALIIFLHFSNKQFKIGKSYYGFELYEKKNISEINSNVFIFKHKKSGASLIYIKNDDANKIFSINFRTPTSDSSGVNHILEHSVLCGSQKYPVKDPFLQLGKSSLNTFLNALTYYDKTMYPIGSKNQKDFKNLMSVYLDAVFYPNIYDNQNIFKQEGWRYDINSVKSNLKYNGIVYNEMKGVYSSPLELLNSHILKSLFPDTIYKNDSGGDPNRITNLTYEEFLNTHKKYYKPSNSYIYLYGNLDINETLDYINREYLSKFKYEKVDSEIKKQIPFKNIKEVKCNYAVPKNTNTENKSYMSLNYVIDDIKNKDAILAFEILNNILIQMPSAPLKDELLKSGIGENVYSSFGVDLVQPVYSIIIENFDINKKEEFKKIVDKTLKDILTKGIDPKIIDSIISSYEINMNTINTDKNRGLNFNEAVMRSWLYDGDPTMYLQLEESISNIKFNYKNKEIFEKCIKNYLINNKHSSLVILKAVNGDEKNKNLKEALTEKEIENLVDINKEFKKWQNKIDTEESLLTIPRLKLSDIGKKAQKIITQKNILNGITILSHELFTNKLGFVNYYFDSTTVPQDKIFYMYLLSELLGEVETKNYKVRELSQKIMQSSGNISFEVCALPKFKDNNIYYPKFIVSSYTLNDKMQENLKIINEILNNSVFTDIKKCRESIKEIKANLSSQISEDSLSFASSRLKSYFSNCDKYEEQGMLPYYNFICQIDKTFDQNHSEICKNLKVVSELIFNKENLIVSYTGDNSGYKNFLNCFIKNETNIRNSNSKNYNYDFNKKSDSNNEGIIIPSKVQYVAKGYNYNKLGYEYDGSMRVLKNIIDNEYLWQEIRVKGGAYGGFMSLDSSGNIEFMSYRDPNLIKTLDKFDEIGSYIKGIKLSEEDLNNHIIGAIGNMDSLKNPYERGRLYDEYYIKGITQSDIQKERDSVLKTDINQIRNYGEMIQKITEMNKYCIIGNESIIMRNENIFESTINVLECVGN